MKLLECVPNFAEGRNHTLVAKIANACASSGASLLDVHSDADHNRTVVTLAGSMQELIDGLLAGIEVAVEALDIREIEGVHPRSGVVDVVPFVPLRDSEMADAVEAARSFAEEVARRWRIPCYFYDHASSRKTTLPELRRSSSGAARPDAGPPLPHPTAGAISIGARPLLVAYNIDLPGECLPLARWIAATIRGSSGGDPNVRALGLPLIRRGRSQVSMNLLDPAVTTIPMMFDRVAALARQAGVDDLASELVGLAPKAAFGPEPVRDLRFAGAPRILEEVLEQAGL